MRAEAFQTQSIDRSVRLLCFTWIACIVAANFAGAAEIGYRRDILPILSDRCFKCHGPDSASRQAGLRLDRPEAAAAELQDGARAIVPGKPERANWSSGSCPTTPTSRCRRPTAAKRCRPPKKICSAGGSKKGPNTNRIGRLSRRCGRRCPRSRHAARQQSDRCLRARAARSAKDIEPAPRASKERLIRRLYFDLIGLPPTLAEIDAFLADDSPDAYERVVDRLMQSPHYGERMAADWLDGARYADSNGYQNDFARNMSPWRDWVIARVSIAHAVRPVRHRADWPATCCRIRRSSSASPPGFNRNHRTVTEAGSIEEEWFVENVVDRVETMGTVMLGLTVGCARCHDHKFDPISQREFYQLFAFFNNVNEKGVYTETRGNVPPLVKVTTPSRRRSWPSSTRRSPSSPSSLTIRWRSIGPHRQAWIDSLPKRARPRRSRKRSSRIDLRKDATARVAVTGSERAARREVRPRPNGATTCSATSAVFNGKQHLDYPGLNFPPARSAVQLGGVGQAGRATARFFPRSDKPKPALRGCDLFSVRRRQDRHAHHRRLAGQRAESVHAAAAAAGQVVARRRHVRRFEQGGRRRAVRQRREAGTSPSRSTSSTARSPPSSRFASARARPIRRCTPRSPTCGCFIMHSTASEVEKVVPRLRPARTRRRKARRNAMPSCADSSMSCCCEFARIRLSSKIAECETRRGNGPGGERQVRRGDSHHDGAWKSATSRAKRIVLQRGRYDLPDKSAEAAARRAGRACRRLPADAPRNRLGLARWLTSPQNPLTARVVVNRLWQQFFRPGAGEDVGQFRRSIGAAVASGAARLAGHRAHPIRLGTCSTSSG